MEVHCAGCAGCCIDWRPLVDAPVDHERRGPRPPLDDTYNLVACSRDEVRAFLEAGYGDALTARLWEAEEDDDALEVDGHRVAAIAGRPAFVVGLRKVPKPVAPFERETAAWLPTCAFLDPATLQCRIHGDDVYPAECAAYPAHNVALEVEAECERVEAAFGDERLVEGDGDGGDAGVSRADPDPADRPLFGPQAIGGKVFAHPRPEALEGVVDRAARGALTREDRAELVAVAAASSPGTLALSEPHYEDARRRVLEADSWVGRAATAWSDRAAAGEDPSPAHLSRIVEGDRGAPETPGWDGAD